MKEQRARPGDLPPLRANSSPGKSNSVAHRLSSPPPLRMDWSNLGEGPAGMIAERVLANDLTDYVRFRAVCRPWRQCSANPRAHGILDRRFHPRRWIMLREKNMDLVSLRERVADPERRRLLNVSTGQCVRVHLPELRGHDVCSPTVEGLLVLLNRATYAVRLLNPLTRQVADLPPATTLYPLLRCAGMYDAIPRLDFEVSGAGLADDDTIAVLFEDVQMLAVAKPGDEEWTLVEQGISLSPAISFAGRFYCTCASDEDIKMVDTTRDNQPPRLVVAAKINPQFSGLVNTAHLLDNDGELLLLTRTLTSEARYLMQYKVSRVDLDARTTLPIRDLGGRAVFIGSSCAISVCPLAFPAIRKDSVYLGQNHVLGDNLEAIGPYKVMDGTGTTMRFDTGGFDTDKDIIARYGPHSIIEYLSQYVTKSPSVTFPEGDTSDSDADANCIIC